MREREIIMAKKKNKISCGVITSMQIFDAQKTQFNGFGCGHGPHKSKKAYNRKDKSWRKELGYR